MMEQKACDVAIIGGGPAGLSAAVTARIRNKSVILFEHLGFSRKLRKAPLVDNYLGMPGMTGNAMMENFVEHCRKLETTIVEEKIVNIYPGDSLFTLVSNTNAYEARSVIICTGVVNTALMEGERDFLGRGVSYCTTCDAMLFKNKKVAVVSYTEEGEKEANFLNEICSHVVYIPQYTGEFRTLHEKVEVVKDRPKAVRGGTSVEALIGKERAYSVAGVFVLRLSDPVENIISGLELDGEVIRVKRDMSTNLPGIFAAGDCTGKPFQVSKAVGEGLVAALSSIQYLDSQS